MYFQIPGANVARPVSHEMWNKSAKKFFSPLELLGRGAHEKEVRSPGLIDSHSTSDTTITIPHQPFISASFMTPNVEPTGAARLYRAASNDRRE